MTSGAMIAGMAPMALGLGEGGEQTAPLGRAVIGGLAAATLTTLFVLPSVFAAVQGRAARASASIDPFDPESPQYVGARHEEGSSFDADLDHDHLEATRRLGEARPGGDLSRTD
jgi:hypothetical protein